MGRYIPLASAAPRRPHLNGELVHRRGSTGKAGQLPAGPHVAVRFCSRSHANRVPSTPNFGSAADAAAAIASRHVSSVELTQHTLERIDRFEPLLNVFAYQLRDEALAHARRVDAAIAAGDNPGPLGGVPVVVKESFAVAGHPCTWGIPALKVSRAARDSTVVKRLSDAGAVILGATNVPLNLFDGQTYNEFYGTTNNPWDLTRTPGGSSGGTAAALAAGLGFLGVGSDIGGSIRSPAHCCGIFGHKPTLDVVGLSVHSPGGISGNAGFTTLLATAGPMSRTAGDLQLGLEVLGGPATARDVAYTWKLPARTLRPPW